MQIAIRHRTTYRYDQPALYSVQSLRLTPAGSNGQRIASWRIEAPGIERAATFVDGFGNRAHLITVDGPHQEIAIEVRGEVETVDTAGVVEGTPEPAPVVLYLRETVLTRPSPALRELAQAAGGEDALARLHDLLRCIRERVAYETGATHAATTAAQALQRGSGVCQDHTHIFIAAARSLDIPARYVSGYLWTPLDTPLNAQHAWAEAHVSGLGWVGFDVANGICPDDRYVRVAVGLDYASAAPVRGSRRGGGEEALEVQVEVGAAQQ